MNKFTFFWNGPFSQWKLCWFNVDGVDYSCAEQYMMAQKAILFNDMVALDKIMGTMQPKKQKEYGRSVKNFDTDKWNSVCKDIVYKGNHAKFTQNKELLKLLLDTAGTELVEASPYDTIWGIGLSATDSDANDKSKWLGTNWLGEILTKLRDDLINRNKRIDSIKKVYTSNRYGSGDSAKFNNNFDYLLFRQDWGGDESVYFNESELDLVLEEIDFGEIPVHSNYSILYCNTEELLKKAEGLFNCYSIAKL
jgi:ribA/ribD-fused uncharacterized protein